MIIITGLFVYFSGMSLTLYIAARKGIPFEPSFILSAFWPFVVLASPVIFMVLGAEKLHQKFGEKP